MRFRFYPIIPVVITVALLTGLFVQPVFATDARNPDVKIYTSDTLELSDSFVALDGKFQGGMSVATGDVTGDGVAEIIVAAHAGGGPQVSIYDGLGNLVKSFFAYDAKMNKGVNVAVGDFDGNGVSEIVTVTNNGVVHARVFNAQGQELNIAGGFFPYGVAFSGGASVATGDINGDGKDEILFGSLQGSSGHVRATNGSGVYQGFDLFPWASQHKGGVSVATANVDGGPEDEVIVGVYQAGESWVKVYKTTGDKKVLGTFRAFGSGFDGGVHVAGGDVDQDGLDEVAVSARAGGGAHVQFFEANGTELGKDIMPYESDFRGGTAISVSDVNNDTVQDIIVVPTRQQSHIAQTKRDMIARGGSGVVSKAPSVAKFIEVDISEQRLRAFENGKEVKTFLISSGLVAFPTPTGAFAVSAKFPTHDYVWSYGANNPNNYNIQDVKHNLRWAPHLYIHAATWHNAFGTRRSHGCINVAPANAEWIYNWTPISTLVLIHD